MEHDAKGQTHPDDGPAAVREPATGAAASPPTRDAGIGVAALDPAGVLVYASPLFQAMWGSEGPDGLCGHAFAELWERDAALEEARARLAAGESWRGELVARRVSGGAFPASAAVDVVRDAEGRHVQTLVSCADLTGKRESVAAARASDAGYAAAFHASPDAMAITRLADGRVIEVNEAFERITGHARQDAVGRSTVELRLWTDTAARDHVVDELRRHGTVRNLELALRRADGTVVYGLFTARTIGIGGQPHLLSLIRDVSALRAAEDAALASGAQLRGILDSLRDGYVRVSLDGVVLSASRSLARMFGYGSPDDMVGLPGPALWAHAEDRVRMRAELQRRGHLDEFVFEARRKDGSTFWAAMNVEFFLDADGGAAGTEGLIRDTSERVRSEAALRESERRLDEVAAQSRTWAWEVDADGLYTYASHVVRDVLGYEPADLVGRLHFYDLHPEEARDEFRQAAFAVFARREPFVGLDSLAQAADGSPVWVSTNGVPVLGEGGELLGYRGSDTDITRRKLAEDELRQFRLMVDQANYGAAVAAMDGTLTYVNAAMAAMHGRTVDELTGRHLSVCHSPEQLPRVGELLEVIVRDGSFSSEEVWHARRDGSVFPALMNAITIDRPHGGPPLQSVTALDISDLKAAEAEIRELNADLERRVRERTEELQAANQEIEAFSYSVSHDLRQPLRAIDGFCQILYEDQYDRLDQDGRDGLERVRAAAQKMARLIDDLLSLSRLNRKEMHLEVVDLSGAARGIVARLREAEPDRRVETRIAEECRAFTDAGLAEIVLDNLLRNAWKFTSGREVAHVEFGVSQADGQRVFFVRDDGAGFEPEYADKLFRPFSRLHREDEFPGSGIGLATVQRVVSRLGGRCWAEGAAGAGATFSFTLGEPPD